MRTQLNATRPFLFALFSTINIIVLSTIIAEPQRAYACICRAERSPQNELNDSDVVFVGRVINVVMDSSIRDWVAEFEVERTWKGLDGERLALVNGGNAADCSIEFVQDRKYLVYAVYFDSEERTLLSTDACFRTAYVEHAQGDIQALELSLYGVPLLIGIIAATASIVALFIIRSKL